MRNFPVCGVGGVIAAAPPEGDLRDGQPPRRGCGRRKTPSASRPVQLRLSLLHRDRALRSVPREATARPGRGARSTTSRCARRTTCTTPIAASVFRGGPTSSARKPSSPNPWNSTPRPSSERDHGQRIWTVLQLRAPRAARRFAETSSHGQAVPCTTSQPDLRHRPRPLATTFRGRVRPRSRVRAYETAFTSSICSSGSSGASLACASPARASPNGRLPRARTSRRTLVPLRERPRSSPPESDRREHVPSIVVDGTEVEFSEGSPISTPACTSRRSQERFRDRRGAPSIELAYEIRHAALSPPTSDLFPALGLMMKPYEPFERLRG